MDDDDYTPYDESDADAQYLAQATSKAKLTESLAAMQAELSPAAPVPDPKPEAQARMVADAPPATPNTEQADEQTVEQCMEMALPGLEAGVAPDTIINAMFGNLPEHVKQMLRQRMGAYVIEKNNREIEIAKQTRAAGDQSLLKRVTFDLAAAAALISEATMERIKKLFMSQPNLAQAITREGALLMQFGVMPDKTRMTEASLGRLSPPPIGIVQGQTRQTEGPTGGR